MARNYRKKERTPSPITVQILAYVRANPTAKVTQIADACMCGKSNVSRVLIDNGLRRYPERANACGACGEPAGWGGGMRQLRFEFEEDSEAPRGSN